MQEEDKRAQFMNMMDRILGACGIHSQVELGKILGIRQSTISDAKRRNSIPASWLVTLFDEYGLNPDWIRTGTGNQILIDRKNPANAVVSQNTSELTKLGVMDVRTCEYADYITIPSTWTSGTTAAFMSTLRRTDYDDQYYGQLIVFDKSEACSLRLDTLTVWYLFGAGLYLDKPRAMVVNGKGVDTVRLSCGYTHPLTWDVGFSHNPHYVGRVLWAKCDF